MEEEWRRSGGGVEEEWGRSGGVVEEEWKRSRGRVEEELERSAWRRICERGKLMADCREITKPSGKYSSNRDKNTQIYHQNDKKI